jgi:arylsulfatase
MPTFCELAGADYPQRWERHRVTPCEGKSLMPILRGGDRQPHELLCWEFGGNKAVRAGKWKLVGTGIPSDLSQWELYDLEADRTECENLALHHPRRVERLANAWRNWAGRTGWQTKD